MRRPSIGLRCYCPASLPESSLRNQQRKNPAPFHKSLVFFFIIIVLFASCATAPKITFSEDDEGAELSLLPAGAKLYIWADTVKGMPLLDVLSFEGKSGKDAGKILDSTETAAAAILGEKEGRRFFLAAAGSYPRRSANFSLAFSRAWKKRKSFTGNSYWYSQNDNIALALGSNLALVSDADPWGDPWGNPPGEFPKETPSGAFMEFRRGLVMAGWVPNPSVPINNFVDSLGIPLQIPAEEFFFGVSRIPLNANTAGSNPADSGLWELVFKIKTPSPNHARSLLGLFSMARLFFPRGRASGGGQAGSLSTNNGSISPQDAAVLFFANAPEQDREFLTLRLDPLNEDSIALLFNMFSISFK